MLTVQPRNRILGDRAKYIRLSGERGAPPLGQYGSPPIRTPIRDVGDDAFRLLHNNESFPIDYIMFQKLHAFEQYVQDEGMDWIAYQIDARGKRRQNARIITLASTLRYGTIYWDANGNLLPSSSGSAYSATFNVPATHQNQCNGNISASWALFNTDIPGDCRNLQQYSAFETGMMLETALYGKNIPRYITQNDYVQAFMARDRVRTENFISTAEVMDRMFSISRWIPVYTSFFEDQAGVNQPLWNDDGITFLPSIKQPDKMEWANMYEGSYPVPRTIDVQMDLGGIWGNVDIEYGMFGYSIPCLTPPGREIVTGDTWLWALRNEKAIFQAVVVF